MKAANILTLLAFIQCAQLTHAMERSKDEQHKQIHYKFATLLVSIHNYNTNLASLYIEQDTTLSTAPRFAQIAPEIKTIKAQLPELQSRHTDLLSQAKQVKDLPFLTDTSDSRHAAIQRTEEIIADANNDAKDKKQFLIKHAFHYQTPGLTWNDKVQKTLQIVNENKILVQNIQTQLKSDKTLNEQDRNALTTKRSHIEIGTATLLTTNIEDLQKENARNGKYTALLKQLTEAQKTATTDNNESPIL